MEIVDAVLFVIEVALIVCCILIGVVLLYTAFDNRSSKKKLLASMPNHLPYFRECVQFVSIHDSTDTNLPIRGGETRVEKEIKERTPQKRHLRSYLPPSITPYGIKTLQRQNEQMSSIKQLHERISFNEPHTFTAQTRMPDEQIDPMLRTIQTESRTEYNRVKQINKEKKKTEKEQKLQLIKERKERAKQEEENRLEAQRDGADGGLGGLSLKSDGIASQLLSLDNSKASKGNLGSIAESISKIDSQGSKRRV